MKKIFLVAFILNLASCKLGCDITMSIGSVETYKCLLWKAYSFMIFRAYRSYGDVDSTAIPNIKNAVEAGFNDIEVYIFPCFKCGKPREQVKKTVEMLKDQPYNGIWIDVERYRWGTKESNAEFLKEMLDEASKYGKPVGIYTNFVEWNNIIGKTWVVQTKYKLWWISWDNQSNFKNFRAFGPWKSADIKQYTNEINVCGIEYNQNFKPI